MFKTFIKQRSYLFCCILISFLFAAIQVSIVHAAAQTTQGPLPLPLETPTPTPPTLPTPTPTATTAPVPTPTPTTTAPPVTVTLTSTTVQAGNPVTITGENWLPAQQLNVQIAAAGQSVPLVQGTPSSDTYGHFSITLTIPPTAAPGAYAVSVFATNNPSLHFVQDGMLTVTAPTATPTVTPSPTATATPTPTGSNGGGGSGLTILAFVLGGLGVLFIITGIIMFAASTPTAPAR